MPEWPAIRWHFAMVAALVTLVLLATATTSADRSYAGTARSIRATGAGSLPSSPRGRAIPDFGLGLIAAPDQTGIYGWMPESGIPWDYAYQYLTGGVNTGLGWQTWNPNAQFPLWYAQGADGSYIPVFSYFQLAQSVGPCRTCSGAQQDLTNLNSATLMATYYGDFRKLMQRLGPGTYDGIRGYGGTTIVHVEPDLSAYAEKAAANSSACFGFCTGQGVDPSLILASVASSGDADVAGYANTYQGYSLALAHLRDLYAPNVLLAYHVSNWATGQDISASHSTSLDPRSLGTRAGTFAALAGTVQQRTDTTPYDLVFMEASDRDAAYYKYVMGDDRYWDRLNVTYPNFKRWGIYVQYTVTASTRKAVIWQVPEGNQYYRTSANVTGHYQDNRAEVLLQRVTNLIGVGVVGLLFGSGKVGTTTVHWDKMGDGITNPASFCTTDGYSTGQVCNTHTSIYADDDGGYIRVFGAQFYGVRIPGA